ncbi:uncharacterized protein LOC111700490 [Eurytemora carolleeae]|uniref:uncharacterized protein LOC111700490 n=1 Tax=Eurytemora carolleeae TaxID=1294199 RepID=UPI000C75C430|nr:uncharacterized protein LOC111700490 [Eurytemora carolleeae]|eukprot:XP_023327189.1 uncharacterized protein LOC111700490 [Eurytemora affinis]
MLSLQPVLWILILYTSVSECVDIPPAGADLPAQTPYQPVQSPKIQVYLGERRCDNYYNGAVLPCLSRPWLPPYSYSTTEAYNGEYKKKRSIRAWRTIRATNFLRT